MNTHFLNAVMRVIFQRAKDLLGVYTGLFEVGRFEGLKISFSRIVMVSSVIAWPFRSFEYMNTVTHCFYSGIICAHGCLQLSQIWNHFKYQIHDN